MRNPPGLASVLGGIALGFLAVLVSYGMAHAGHPAAVWFWRDVLGAFL